MAALPLQSDPKEYIEQLLGITSSEEWHGDTSGGDVSSSRGTPLLHEITEQQAALMGLPIKFVHVEEAAAIEGTESA